MSLPDASFTPPPVRQLLLTRTTNRPNRPFAGGLAAFLTIHQTGNRRRGADAHAHARWLARAAPYSWHATIDDREVWQSLDWSEQGWHAGDGRAGPGNTGSIGLEICMHEGIDAARADANAAWLAARLRAAGHGRSGIVQHHRWTGKNCPELIRAEAGRWERFLEAVAAGGPGGRGDAAGRHRAPPGRGGVGAGGRGARTGARGAVGWGRGPS